MVTLTPLEERPRIKLEPIAPSAESDSTKIKLEPVDKPGTAVGRVLTHAGETAAEAFGAEPLGPGPETTKFFQDIGLFEPPDKRTPFGILSESVTRRMLEAGDLVLRGGNVILRTPAAAIGQTARELGASQGDAKRLERDLVALTESAGIVTGARPLRRGVRVSETARKAAPEAPISKPQAPEPPLAAPRPSAEPVASPSAGPAGVPKAGNINLERIFAPEDVKQAIRDTAAANQGFEEARRGTITHEQTREMAQLLGMDEATLIKRMRGQALNAEEMFAARELLVQQAAKVRELAHNEAVDSAKLVEELARLTTIQEQVSGATAEAGRALSQFRMMAGQTAEARRMLESVQNTPVDELAKRIRALDDDPVQLANFARETWQARTKDMIIEAWINGLLSGPTTPAVNSLSNTLTALWAVPETVVASGVSRLSGGPVQLGEAQARLFGFLEGAKDGIRAGVRAFRTEQPSDAALKLDVRRYQAIPSVVFRRGRSPKEIAGVPIPFTGEVQLGGKQARLPGRFLLAEDEFFKAIGYRQELNALAFRQATSEGLKGRARAQRISELKANPPRAMLDAANANAAKQTFTNPLGAIGQSVTNITRQSVLTRVIMPFVRTPTNIVKYATERSPFAPLMKKVRQNLAGKNGPAARDQQIARIALGSTVSTTTAYMALEGNITGGGPSDPAQRAVLYSSGWQPYSVKIGDTYYSYSRIEPMGMLMGIAADMAEINKQATDQELDDIAALVGASVSKNLTSKTWVRGLSEVIEATSDPDRYAEQYLRNQAGTVVPTLLAQVARNQDPFLREAQTIVDQIKSRVPGQRETLPVRRDVFGEPIELEGAAGPDLLSPFYKSQAKNDPAIAEMIRLKVAPGKLRRTIRDVELTAEEYDAYSANVGRRTKQVLDQLVGVKGWKTLSDDQKALIMEDGIRRARDLGRAETLVRHPELGMRILQSQREKARRLEGA